MKSFPNEQNSKKIKTTSGDNSINTRSEKDLEQHCDNSKEVSPEEDRFNNLMQMSRHLAHQLNNLLTTIMANTQLMSMMVRDEERESYLRSIEDATRNAGAIMREFQESIIALARPSTQENTLDEVQRSNRDSLLP